MGMFTKVIAFLDKAAGVPAWVTHAENLRTLEDRGCTTLAKAIVEKSSFHYMASMSVEEVVPELAVLLRGADAGMMQLVHEVIAAVEGPVEGPLQVLYDFVDTHTIEIVDVSTPSSLAKFAEEVFAEEEQAEGETVTDLIPAPLVTSVEDLPETISLVNELSDEENVATLPGAALDPQVRKQLVQGMMKVISRGRKPDPTLKVLKTMACGDQAAIIEALEEMAKQGNRLASAILEDPSL